MRKTREILRLKWLLDRSHREIARVIGVGVGSPTQVVVRAKRAGITCWADVEALSDEDLDARMYPPPVISGEVRPEPNPAVIHLELRRTGVTLRLLHEEYLASNPIGAYGYTKFVELYNAWADRLKVTMRQVHKAGEKCFVDYSGKRPSIVDAKTGVRTEVELFVAVMGASNYTYVEATASQRSSDWIASHVRLVEFLGGTPHALVPDQLKSGVVVASRYEPGIQRTYEEWSQHYSTTILPARPIKPRDKAKVEGGVLIAQRWILARLRNVTCFSLDELNEHIAALVEPASPTCTSSLSTSASGYSSMPSGCTGRTSGSRRLSERRGCGSRAPASRTSTTRPSASSTRRRSVNSARVAGSSSIRTC